MHSNSPMIAARLAFFLLLNLFDLYFTWRLMRSEASVVYESNPLARKCLEAGGWYALVAYKAALVGLVSVAIVVVCRAQPRVGQRLLTGACVIVGCVVLYSFALPEVYGMRDDGVTHEQELEMERARTLSEKLGRLRCLSKDRLVYDVDCSSAHSLTNHHPSRAPSPRDGPDD